MKTFAFSAAAILGFLGVAIGAFGAHAFKDLIALNGYQETFETGTIYHLVHAVLLLGLGLIAEKGESTWLKVGIIACVAGIFLFSGSLYLLSLTAIKWLGAITPLGGVGFLLAWASLLFHSLSKKTNT